MMRIFLLSLFFSSFKTEGSMIWLSFWIWSQVQTHVNSLVESILENLVADGKLQATKSILCGLLFPKSLPHSNTIQLGEAGFSVAYWIFNGTLDLWATKKCNAFIAKYLPLLQEPKEELLSHSWNCLHYWVNNP